MSASAAIDGSSLLSAVRRGVTTSRLVAHVRRGYAQLRVRTRETSAWLGRSRVVSAVTAAMAALTGMGGASMTHAMAGLVSRWVRASFLYRWLTAEPEPEVIVIDLRDTLSVGPFIAVIERVFKAIVPASHHSTIQAFGTRIGTYFHRRPIRATSLIIIAMTSSFLVVATIRETLTATATAVASVVLFLSILGLGSRRSWDDLVASRLVQLLIAIFEPPEPPESEF